jgi:Ni,Fe-hydrogenase I large subunit
MRITRDLLVRLEGEVELKLFWSRGRIKDAYLIIPSYRGFEEILKGKPVLDALVINPRICGICGHAHLRATVEALEDALRRRGVGIFLSAKAKTLREVTSTLEIVQNHLRWFYLYFMPEMVKLERGLEGRFSPFKGSGWREGIQASNLATRAIAVLAGQWPHSSYMFPGGVTCDPMETDLRKVESLTEKVVEFFQERLIDMSWEDYLKLKGSELLRAVGGDLGRFVSVCMEHNLNSVGRSYGRFLTGGSVHPCVSSGVKSRRICEFHVDKVSEIDTYSFLSGGGKGYTWAKAVRYRGLPYETGPLARQMISRNPRITYLYRRYGDSVMVRVWARVEEILLFSLSVLEKLRRLDLSEQSWREVGTNLKKFSGEGVGVVEAARGTLIHKVRIERGKIASYDIITPTVWNLGPRDDRYLGVAEKAVLGLTSQRLAHIVIRSFDACSVCTSH